MASSASHLTSSSDFHKVRLREMRREQDCAAGLPPSEIAPMYFVPSLREICARSIAENFEALPSADRLMELDEELYALVIDQLPATLRLEVAVPRIASQDYWRAACEARWSAGQLSAYTGTGSLTPPAVGGWKRVFLQRHVAERLMSMETGEPAEADLDALEGLRALCGAEVYELVLTHQRCHFDVAEFVGRLPRCGRLRITYNVLNASVAFRPDMVGMRQGDALSIQRLLKTYPPLTRLELPGNRIDSSLLKAILVGMVRNGTLEHLDLSHNAIDDDGASALAVIMMKRDSSLLSIDLSSNAIRAEGAKLLGKALGAESCRIEKFSLRMNRLGDAGGERFFSFFSHNRSVASLDVSCNELGPETCEALASCLKNAGASTTLADGSAAASLAATANGHAASASSAAPPLDSPALVELDISGNRLGDEGGRLLLQGLTAAPRLTKVNCRQSGVSPADQTAISELCYDRSQAQRLGAVANKEAALEREREWLVADRVRKSHGDGR